MVKVTWNRGSEQQHDNAYYMCIVLCFPPAVNYNVCGHLLRTGYYYYPPSYLPSSVNWTGTKNRKEGRRQGVPSGTLSLSTTYFLSVVLRCKMLSGTFI